MDKELDYRDDELVDLGAATEETHGGPIGEEFDLPLPRVPLGILVD